MSSRIRTPCEGVHIFNIGHWSNLQKEFCRVYRDCFGGPPYYEEYEDDWIIENVYNKHIGHGCVSVALRRGELVGLSCAERMIDDAHSSPYRYLVERSSDLEFSLDSACYIAEVAVVYSMRRRGIGTDLLKVLCNWGLARGLTHYTARTAAEGSHSLGMPSSRSDTSWRA
jgi:GNAT superfamily N-acetyltransferase